MPSACRSTQRSVLRWTSCSRSPSSPRGSRNSWSRSAMRATKTDRTCRPAPTPDPCAAAAVATRDRHPCRRPDHHHHYHHHHHPAQQQQHLHRRRHNHHTRCNDKNNNSMPGLLRLQGNHRCNSSSQCRRDLLSRQAHNTLPSCHRGKHNHHSSNSSNRMATGSTSSNTWEHQ